MNPPDEVAELLAGLDRLEDANRVDIELLEMALLNIDTELSALQRDLEVRLKSEGPAYAQRFATVAALEERQADLAGRLAALQASLAGPDSPGARLAEAREAAEQAASTSRSANSVLELLGAVQAWSNTDVLLESLDWTSAPLTELTKAVMDQIRAADAVEAAVLDAGPGPRPGVCGQIAAESARAERNLRSAVNERLAAAVTWTTGGLVVSSDPEMADLMAALSLAGPTDWLDSFVPALWDVLLTPALRLGDWTLDLDVGRDSVTLMGGPGQAPTSPSARASGRPSPGNVFVRLLKIIRFLGRYLFGPAGAEVSARLTQATAERMWPRLAGELVSTVLEPAMPSRSGSPLASFQSAMEAQVARFFDSLAGLHWAPQGRRAAMMDWVAAVPVRWPVVMRTRALASGRRLLAGAIRPSAPLVEPGNAVGDGTSLLAGPDSLAAWAPAALPPCKVPEDLAAFCRLVEGSMGLVVAEESSETAKVLLDTVDALFDLGTAALMSLPATGPVSRAGRMWCICAVLSRLAGGLAPRYRRHMVSKPPPAWPADLFGRHVLGLASLGGPMLAAAVNPLIMAGAKAASWEGLSPPADGPDRAVQAVANAAAEWETDLPTKICGNITDVVAEAVLEATITSILSLPDIPVDAAGRLHAHNQALSAGLSSIYSSAGRSVSDLGPWGRFATVTAGLSDSASLKSMRALLDGGSLDDWTGRQLSRFIKALWDATANRSELLAAVEARLGHE